VVADGVRAVERRGRAGCGSATAAAVYDLPCQVAGKVPGPRCPRRVSRRR
jgi:hypothetical protein